MDTRSSKVMIHFRKVQSWALAGGGGAVVLRISSDFSSGLVSGAHNPERSTAINSCNRVFTSEFIFR